MEDYAAELRELAAVLGEAKYETNLARKQSTKPKSLSIRIRGAAVQAARAVIKAVDVGFIELLPPLPWKREPDGTLSDATAFTAWTSFICPLMRSQCATLKANARAVAHDTDHYDVDDGLEHLRIQASHWVDICDTAAKLIREEASRAGNKTADEQPEPARPKGTVNQRMLELMQKNPEAMGWKCRQWAEHLKCAKSTVVATKTWRQLEFIRLDNKAKRMVDKRRNRQLID